MAFGMWKKNRHTVKKHEREAKEWDKKTKELSFKLHPLSRGEGQLRSYFPCGHHITFPSRPCHRQERKELLDKELL